MRDEWSNDDTLIEYRRQRADAARTVDGHWDLAEWCRKHGLDEQRRAHLTAVLDIDPDHDRARKALGFVRVGPFWQSKQEQTRRKQDAQRIQRNLKRWQPRIARIFRDLMSTKIQQKSAAMKRLDAISDPSAIPALEWGIAQNGPAMANLIVIEHRLSEDQCFTTIYGHLANDRHVQIGDFVTAGQLIGSIGRKSAVINGGYEPHLHFGVRAGRFLSRGATLFSVPINGQQTFVRLGTAGETQMTLELPPGLPDMWGVSLSGTNIAVRRIDGAFRMPAWVLWDHMPPEANIVGYSPTLNDWYDPIAFLRQHQAHTNPAPYMSPTLDRKAGKRKHVVDRQAADWKVNEWIRPPSESARDVADLKGKTVCLVCVQAACRASSSHALPMVTALSKQYAADDSVQIVVVQTAFRDFRRNSLANAKRLAKSLPDTVAVGHTGDSKHRPAVLDNYGIAGTPWVVIIDASGKVAFSAVHLRAEQVGRIIDGLKQPKTELTDADAPLLSE